MSGANLSGANLSKANLEYANLTGANLCGADLRGAYVPIPDWIAKYKNIGFRGVEEIEREYFVSISEKEGETVYQIKKKDTNENKN